MSDTPVSLLERLRAQPSPDAWRQLVDLYTPLIYHWLSRYPVQCHDADDLVQEVLTVIVRELPHFTHSRRRGAFRHWLRTVTVNCLRMFWRAQRVRPQAAGDSDLTRMLEVLEDPDSGLSRLWDQEHDRHVIGCLLRRIEGDFAPSTWHAFRLLVLEARPAEEVAAGLGLSVNAVLIAKSRVFQRLRREAAGLID